ncbi:1-acyl-sn-glycerol-3-phosphate acyltransferase [Frankia sp. AgKG'84/4]|uniref:1-acyl-sn-glycerol-3-phosphate acyltransferase n=1 Tax=Frankia sp. AgKG'84/4 TaxID=573490 RepID=UPI00200BF2F1|nr:1-acyl-sn-glycerol-3-phosphate acyltransferase [Frankia sp. AgKG'84/4]MCL9794543.1 1-acyl-sn-glycerol-3-phosphate acyltransferase [Frankia sp. AgKG'84/4]
MGVPPKAVRRLLVDPLFVPVAAVLAVVALAMAVLGLLTAPLDRRLRVSRAAMLAADYLAAEVVVLLAAFGLWLVRPLLGRRRYEAAHVWLLRRVLTFLLGAARVWLRFRLEILEPPPEPAKADADDDAEVGPDAGPSRVLVLSRHAGPGDSFVLIHLLLTRYGLVPRVVLIDRLQLDPAIDVLLGRLGACFLRNDGSDDTATRRIGALARGLGDAEALVIFPEGANFTPSRRRRLIARLRARGQWDRAAVAEDFDAVLPPRPAGVLAALAAGTITATMVVAHAGLDEFSAPGEVWRAMPLATPLLLRWWRVPMAQIPASDAGRRQWLTMHWAIVNAWIGLRHDGDDAPDTPAAEDASTADVPAADGPGSGPPTIRPALRSDGPS